MSTDVNWPLLVDWIDGDPPEDRRTRPTRPRNHTIIFAIGQLMTQPGRWAVLPTLNTGSATSTLKKYGCECLQRTGDDGVKRLYARFPVPGP